MNNKMEEKFAAWVNKKVAEKKANNPSLDDELKKAKKSIWIAKKHGISNKKIAQGLIESGMNYAESTIVQALVKVFPKKEIKR